MQTAVNSNYSIVAHTVSHPKLMTDEELMLKAKLGNMNCISELFTRYQKVLYNFYYSQSKNDSLSKDLVQNVFERVIKYREKYHSGFPFKSWIFRMAWNEQNDYYRKKRITLPGEDRLYDILSHLDEESDEFMDEQKAQLKKAMSQLTHEQKQLLQMTQFQGFKYSEVAEILDCKITTVKVRVHRTIKSLRNAYYNC